MLQKHRKIYCNEGFSKNSEIFQRHYSIIVLYRIYKFIDPALWLISSSETFDEQLIALTCNKSWFPTCPVLQLHKWNLTSSIKNNWCCSTLKFWDRSCLLDGIIWKTNHPLVLGNGLADLNCNSILCNVGAYPCNISWISPCPMLLQLHSYRWSLTLSIRNNCYCWALNFRES